jgi:hypothetical protein
MRFRLALGVSAMVGALVLPAAAYAVPGDRAISDPAPGRFRLNERTLEPGCFSPRFVPSNIDLSSFDTDILPAGSLPDAELRVANRSGDDLFSYNIDQVLVPSSFGGYNVYDDFNRHGADIAPGEQEGELFAPDANRNGNPDPIENDDVILCVSDETSPQNEPYQQEDGGLVSAKNRVVIQPKVTALGVSAITNLRTYKVGFGYDTPTWYSMPDFDGHGLFAPVTDPEGSSFDSAGVPQVVRLRARGDGHPYDSRRVNDVDKAGESWAGPDADDGQDVYFRHGGDQTAWTDSNGNGLLTTLTQGDLPIKWTVRPSLASPGSIRSAELTDGALRAWEASWQAYYIGKGPKPTMPLAPGTNSPTPNTTVIVNLPESRPTSAPQVVVNPASVTVQAPATAPASAPKAAAKKVASAKQKKAYKRCVKKANAKHSKKARSKARAKCARMPH